MDFVKSSFSCLFLFTVILATLVRSQIPDLADFGRHGTSTESTSTQGSEAADTDSDEDSDSSETVRPNSTVNDSTSGTSDLPTLTSTTIPFIEETSSPLFCPCDSILHSCEMNCCCDPDCTDATKALFSPCLDLEALRKISASRDSRRCIKSDFLFRNNTLYKTETSTGGLFCVVKQNLKKEQEFPTSKVNLDRISSDTKSKFFWHLTREEFAQEPSKYFYKYGHQLQLAKRLKHASETYMRIGMAMPSPAFGKSCGASSPVTFLQNQVSQCHLQVFNLSHQCQNTEILNVRNFLSSDSFIVANPSLNLTRDNLVNFTYLLCPSKNSIPDEKAGCSNGTKILRSPSYKLDTCNNVLRQLDIVFQHRGTEGIVHVMAHIYYANIAASTTSIHQKFSASYDWESSVTDDIHQHPPRPVSGNPGYIIGKPVLTGSSFKSQDIVQVTSKGGAEKVLVETIEKQGLAIRSNDVQSLTSMTSASCENAENSKGVRKEILFGYDLSVSCLLEYVNLRTCQNVQRTIGNIFFGMSPQSFTQRYVGALGNPNLLISSHWIPWTISEDAFSDVGTSSRSLESGCHGIMTALHLHFVFARVGSVHFPQLKILGAYIHYGGSTIIHRKEENVTRETSIFVTTTAKFTDVTPPPVTPIPKWPVISIRLPQDFFYPFSIATSNGHKPAFSRMMLVPAFSIIGFLAAI